MKIALFFPQDRFFPWSMRSGIARALRGMDHDVTVGAIPTENTNPGPQQFDAIKSRQPSLELLKGQDLIILSAPERLIPWLDTIYGKYEWRQLGAQKASWYHESFYCEDYTLDFDVMKDWADEHFLPACQDAEFFDQDSFAKGHAHWLPFGVDTEMFHLRVHAGATTWPIAFFGSFGEKRQAFMRALAKHHIPKIRMGRVSVEDFHGWDPIASNKLLSENLRSVRVFLQLPTTNKLLSPKAYEVMACETLLLYPLMGEERGASKNLDVFESGKHLIYYRPSNLAYLAQLLHEWSSDEMRTERERIRTAGCQEVCANHQIKHRVEAILKKCGVVEAVR